MTLDGWKKHRENEVVFNLAAFIARERYADDKKKNTASQFRDLVPIVRRWLKEYVDYQDDTFMQYFLCQPLAEEAAERIYKACTVQPENEKIYQPIFDPFKSEGSTNEVEFLTSKKMLYKSVKSHVNIAVCDSSWEIDFCKALENAPHVYSYVRNERLDFFVPYTVDGKKIKRYFPDFIVRINDRNNTHDLLNLVVEIKGHRDEIAKVKADTMKRLWVPSVNGDGRWGRWAFVEIMDIENACDYLAEYALAKSAA